MRRREQRRWRRWLAAAANRSRSSATCRSRARTAPRRRRWSTPSSSRIQQRDGQVAGLKIEYESLDDATAQAGQWDAAKCAENAQRAAQDEAVVGWIGPFNSGCAATQIPTLNEAGLAMVSPANTYIGLTKPGGEPDEPDKYYPTGERNYARVIVADDKQGQAGAALMEEEGVESVYILDDKETYGKGLADQFEQAAEEQGIEVIGREGIDGSAANYRSLMNKIAAG